MSNNPYGRLDDTMRVEQNLYPNVEQQPHPVIMQDSINYGQPVHISPVNYVNQGYAPPNQYQNQPNAYPPPQNQGFYYNQGPIQNQGFQPNPQHDQNQPDPNTLNKFGSAAKSLCLCALFLDAAYIIFDITYYGFSLNIVFLVMIFQIFRMGGLFSGIKNNQATFQYYLTVKKSFVCCLVCYVIFFTVGIMLIIFAYNITENSSDDNDMMFYYVYIGVSIFFVLIRMITLGTLRKVQIGAIRPAVVIFIRQQ